MRGCGARRRLRGGHAILDFVQGIENVAIEIAMQRRLTLLYLDEKRLKAVREGLDIIEPDRAGGAFQTVRVPGRLGQIAWGEGLASAIDLGHDLADGFEVLLVLYLKDLKKPLADRGQTAYLSIV
jgi:hypothetical protein